MKNSYNRNYSRLFPVGCFSRFTDIFHSSSDTLLDRGLTARHNGRELPVCVRLTAARKPPRRMIFMCCSSTGKSFCPTPRRELGENPSIGPYSSSEAPPEPSRMRLFCSQAFFLRSGFSSFVAIKRIVWSGTG